MQRRRLALFGGSFDPPHVGHLMAALYVLAVERLDGLLVVPCPEHPLAKSLTAWRHREAMCRLAFRGMDRVEISDVEKRLGPPTRTIRTVEHLLSQHPDWSLALVVGADILDEVHQWEQWDRIVTLVDLVVVGRGEAGGRVRIPGVSSSDVRRALQARQDVSDMVPWAVLDYIRREGLYRAADSESR